MMVVPESPAETAYPAPAVVDDQDRTNVQTALAATRRLATRRPIAARRPEPPGIAAGGAAAPGVIASPSDLLERRIEPFRCGGRILTPEYFAEVAALAAKLSRAS